MSQEDKTLPSPPGWAGALLLAVVGLGLMLAAQANFGLWEPWETSWAEIARAMRDSGDWFAPTFDGRPASRPLLPLWLIALGQGAGATSELGMRLPLSLCVLGGALALYAWLRRAFGPWRGLFAAAAALGCPLVLLSGATLAGNGAALGALMASVAALGAALHDPGPRWRPALFGASLAVGVLAMGAWGALLPLLLLGAVALAQTFDADAQQPPRKAAAIALAVAAAAIAAATFWARAQSWSPLSTQVLGLLTPAALLLAALAAAWGAPAARALLALPRAALSLGPPALTFAFVSFMFQSQVTGDLSQGSALLEQLGGNLLVSDKALPEHVEFDFWVRQIGFAAYPWTALLPFGFAWLLRGRGPRAEDTEADARELLGAWFVGSALLMFLLGSLWEHYLFPGTAAVGAIAALAISDGAWWRHLRASSPLLLRAIGFATLLTILFLSKDLDRYPRELLGPLLTDGQFTVPEGFGFGRSLKVIRYGLLGVVFFAFMDVPALVRGAWSLWRARRAPASAPMEADSDEVAPAVALGEPAWLGLLERGRRPVWFVGAFGLLALAFVVLTGFRWVPQLSHHLSQKGLLEAYQERAKEGEELLTYQLGSSSASFYLSEVKKISTLAQLKEAFKGEERFFLVLPRDQLSQLNYEIRREEKPRRNIHVIDDRSSRYVLASNRLGEGERELSPVANAILPERPKPVFPVVFTDEKQERQYAQFDGQVQVLGYELYHADEVDRFGEPTAEARANLEKLKKNNELPKFKAGEKMVVRYYFKVLKRISGAKEIFLHVDYPGARINGDHQPMQGQFPTNHWLPGDYVVDTQWLEVEPGSPSGEYGLHVGFFQGSRRMEVTPKTNDTRDNRVTLGKVRIEGF